MCIYIYIYIYICISITQYIFLLFFLPRPPHLFRLRCRSRPKPRWCSPAHCLNVRSVVQEAVEALSSSAMSMNVMWKKKVVGNCILVRGEGRGDLNPCPGRCSRCHPWSVPLEEWAVDVKVRKDGSKCVVAQNHSCLSHVERRYGSGLWLWRGCMNGFKRTVKRIIGW